MGTINDRQDNTSIPNRSEDLPAIATSLTATVLGWLQGFNETPVLASVNAGLSVATLGLGFLSSLRVQQQLDLFRDEVRATLEEIGVRLDAVAASMHEPVAEEALLVALQTTVTTTSQSRVRRVARVVARTAASETPIWAEADEFIRSLQQINEADMEGLNILWAVQRSAFRVMTNSGREFSTDMNDYNKGWKDVLEIVAQKSVSKEEWASRCARLSGFGLAVQVPPNMAYQGTGDVCFRLTTRATRLLALLGRSTDPGTYPKAKYHRNEPVRIVNDEDEESALGPGWSD